MRMSLGSSEVATALGLNPWGSEYQLVMQLLGLLPRYGGTDTPATRRGRGLELGLALWFAQERGFNVVPGPKLDMPGTVHPRIPWLHSRVDFYAWEKLPEAVQPVPPTSVGDVKTSRMLDEVIVVDGVEHQGWGPDGTDRIPAHMVPQMLTHLACHPKAERCWVVALGTLNDDFRVYCLERSAYEKRIARMERAIEAWVLKRLVNKELPPADGRPATSKAMDLATPASEWTTARATGELATLVGAMRAKRSALRVMERSVEQVKQQVKMAMGGATELVDERGRSLATWRPGADGRRRLRLLDLGNDNLDEEDER